MPETRSSAPLVWIDCEMTGLDYENDEIISIACFVTDADLNTLDDVGYVAVIHQPKEIMDRMGEWCTRQHGASGLTQAVLASHLSSDKAASELFDYIQKFCPGRREALLAGNSVHADRAFLRREPYKKIISHLHHRIFDVSSIKEAMRRWSPMEVVNGSPMKRGLHDAKADILESIAEAKYYRQTLFLKESSTFA
ncbi:hypothetical protein FH972_026923 [Carpinus fangiana]|uniref:Exonuclease domain-containing protein n=1 Tax=Carpinus fangiana TaxID=176857 RepID=A0A5N6L5F2_9ROSI|nr:hypothetical protein FH972_026923 [Carpinus fangiana]